MVLSGSPSVCETMRTQPREHPLSQGLWRSLRAKLTRRHLLEREGVLALLRAPLHVALGVDVEEFEAREALPGTREVAGEHLLQVIRIEVDALEDAVLRQQVDELLPPDRDLAALPVHDRHAEREGQVRELRAELVVLRVGVVVQDRLDLDLELRLLREEPQPRHHRLECLVGPGHGRDRVHGDLHEVEARVVQIVDALLAQQERVRDDRGQVGPAALALHVADELGDVGMHERLPAQEVEDLDAQGVELVDPALELRYRDLGGARRVLVAVGTGQVAVVGHYDLGVHGPRVHDPLGSRQHESKAQSHGPLTLHRRLRLKRRPACAYDWVPRESGGTGRRAGLRIPWGNSLEGSNPSSRTRLGLLAGRFAAQPNGEGKSRPDSLPR